MLAELQERTQVEGTSYLGVQLKHVNRFRRQLVVFEGNDDNLEYYLEDLVKRLVNGKLYYRIRDYKGASIDIHFSLFTVGDTRMVVFN